MSRWIYTSDKALRRSSPIILRKSVLRCCKVEFAFFLSGFSFTNIHDSQDSRGKGGYLFMTCLICLVSVMTCIFNCEEFIYGTFEDCIGLRNSHYCSSYFRISTRVTMGILHKCLDTFSEKTSTISLTLIFKEFIFNFDVCCVSRKFSAWRTVRFLTIVIDVVLEQYDNCLSINKWLGVKHVSIVLGQTYVNGAELEY